MATENVSLPVATAVFIGSAILVGGPVTGLIVSFLASVVQELGLSLRLGGAEFSGIVWTGLTVLLWLQLSYEVASLQLHGIDGLHHGPRWAVVARHLVLSVLVVVTLTALAWGGVALVFATKSLTAAVLGSLLGLACVVVLLRAGGAFRDGLFGESPS
jgi:hypothetical protein